MPSDEQGDKWACEPCIRGHRSTRCEHWDRFMLRVKKPGRPLSSCPHPKGSCPCGKEKVMMVRIPKASSCICAPAYTLGTDVSSSIPDQRIPVNARTGSPNPLTYAGSVSIGTSGGSNPAPYRIQKGMKRSGSVIDPQAISRAFDVNRPYATPVDSPTANVSSDSQSFYSNVGPYTTEMSGAADVEITQPMPQNRQSRPSVPSVSPSEGITASEASLQDWNAYPADILIPQIGQEVCKQDVQHTLEPPRSLSERSRHSCCQPTWNTEDDTIIEQENIVTKAGTTNATQEQNGNRLQEGQVLRPLASYDQHLGLSKTAEYQPGAQLLTSKIGMYSTYSFPSSYSIANSPLNPEQPLGHQQMSPEISQTGESLVPNPAHNCNCGDDCDCLGCAAHPYNATTRHHVEDLSRILARGNSGRPSHSPETTQDKPDSTANNYGAGHHFASESSRIFSPILVGASGTTGIPNHDEFSTASPFLEPNQSLDSGFSSRDFYTTMEFPLESTEVPYYGCSDVSGTCMYGDDCTCIGCLTHSGHNGDPPLVESPNRRLNEPD